MHTLRRLVAEDQINDLFLLRQAFDRAGFTGPISYVRDCQETIDYLRGENVFHDRHNHPFPSLLLLDLKMPRLDGFGPHLVAPTALPCGVCRSLSSLRQVNRKISIGPMISEQT